MEKRKSTEVNNTSGAEKRTSKKNKLMAMGVGAVLAIGLSACGSNEDKVGANFGEQADTSSSEYAEPQSGLELETEESINTEAEEEMSIEALRIPAESSPEEVSKRMTDLRINWVEAGATKEEMPSVQEDYFAWNGDIDSFRQQIIGKNTEKFAPILVGSNWSNDATSIEIVDEMEVKNENHIIMAMKAYGSGVTHPEIDDVEVYDVEEYAVTENWLEELSSIDEAAFGRLRELIYDDGTDINNIRVISHSENTPSVDYNEGTTYSKYKVQSIYEIDEDGNLNLSFISYKEDLS